MAAGGLLIEPGLARDHPSRPAVRHPETRSGGMKDLPAQAGFPSETRFASRFLLPLRGIRNDGSGSGTL